ncbi:MAG TPA: ABC transporter permease, partial [Ktedonobacteraceae bacterium]
LVQGVAVIAFGLVMHVPFSASLMLGLLMVALPVCLVGGAFGLLLLSSFGSQRAANQILPFLIFSQFFLAGIFSPIKKLPWYFNILSLISPLRYAVDLTRNVYYAGQPEYSKVVLDNPLSNMTIMVTIFVVFLVIGTALFVRSERNR